MYIVYSSFFLIIILYFDSCSGFGSRLVGGAPVPLNFVKYHASLQNLTGHHVCGGAILSLSYVVTAAHCVQGAYPQYIKIVVGTTNLDIGGKSYDVDSVLIYPNYDTNLRMHDVALIKSVKPFEEDSVQVLEFYNDELREDDSIFVTGFGAMEPNGETSRKMYALSLPVFNQETCQYAMRHSREVFDTMFCTFTQIGQGTCHGDSGGPLLKDNKLAGIVSWGIPCAVGFPDVHTRIKPYIQWILSVINNKTT